MSGHKILTTSYLVVALKGLAERLALFLKYFFMGENTGMKVRMTGDRFTGARLPFGVSSDLSYHR